MKNIAVKVSFRLLNSKLNKEKDIVPVYMRLRFNGQYKNLSNGIWISSSDWIKKKCRIKGTSYKAVTMNNQLSDLENRVYEIISDLVLAPKRLDKNCKTI
ncbi:Arm DNA-binding domain-containing protein [Parafilimonas sp.]|uniref:Arm DNA-binding domain-containing protein n=1 Tax=Parafilimonas sp. TaxID=1969739 RepID=UPI0039E2BC19